MANTTDIFLRPVPRKAPNIRLFCFAHAGGGASMFARWAFEANPDIEVFGVQPPGRETRVGEPPVRSMDALVRQITNELLPHLGTRFAFFGHSMGSLVAFEVARELRRRGAPGPQKLLLSAFRTPGASSPMTKHLSLPDEEFIERVGERYGALPPAILENQELLAHYLPALRADFELLATYRFVPDAPLTCPLVLYNGLSDGLISPVDLQGWRQMTTRECTERWFPGAHFYLRERRSEVLRSVATDLLGQ